MIDTTTSLNPWPAIRGFVEWIDAANGRDSHELAMRILKVTEEAGEVAQAYIGWQGQNPRKGVTHTRGEVADELCDVAITALTALASLVEEPEVVFDAKLAMVEHRVAALRAHAEQSGSVA